jgi:hypothetical protein
MILSRKRCASSSSYEPLQLPAKLGKVVVAERSDLDQRREKVAASKALSLMQKIHGSPARQCDHHPIPAPLRRSRTSKLTLPRYHIPLFPTL